MDKKNKSSAGFGLHILKNPNGNYSFVGSVPYDLAFVTKTGNKVTREEVESQMMLPASYRTIKTRVFTSKDEAYREAARLGYVVIEGREG